MKTLVVALCTALFVFALASTWSDMLQPQRTILGQKSSSRSTLAVAERPFKQIARPVVAPPGEEELPGPTRAAGKLPRRTSLLQSETSAAAEPLEVNDATLREQMADVKQREARLIARQETLRLICDDIHAELTLVNETRHRADDALIAAEQRVVTVAQREHGFGDNGQPERSRPASAAWGSDELLKPATGSPAVRTTVLLIRRLVGQGGGDTATSLLSRMKPREAAKVLAALYNDDPQMASRLMNSLSAAKESNLQD